MRSTRAATPHSVPPPARVYSIKGRPGTESTYRPKTTRWILLKKTHTQDIDFTTFKDLSPVVYLNYLTRGLDLVSVKLLCDNKVLYVKSVI